MQPKNNKYAKDNHKYAKDKQQKPNNAIIQDLSNLKDITFQNQAIKNGLSELSKSFKQVRVVKGDGNCFYRCAVINYIKKACKQSTLHELFQKDIDFEKFKLNQLQNIDGLTQKFNKEWQTLKQRLSQCKLSVEAEKIICEAINKNSVFDAFCVLYMRYMCYLQIVDNQNISLYRSEEDQRNVLTYGQIVNDVVKLAMSWLLKANLVVHQVSKRGLKRQIIKQQETQIEVHMLFTGHFDYLISKHLDWEKLAKRQQNASISTMPQSKSSLTKIVQQKKYNYLSKDQKEQYYVQEPQKLKEHIGQTSNIIQGVNKKLSFVRVQQICQKCRILEDKCIQCYIKQDKTLSLIYKQYQQKGTKYSQQQIEDFDYRNIRIKDNQIIYQRKQ